MKLKLDENLPGSAATRLSALGFDVDTVLDERLGGQSDDSDWAAAQRERRFLITQDSEQWRVADHLVAWFSDPDARSWTGCLVVATPHKVRVTRPAETP